jgi:hypothetical protein
MLISSHLFRQLQSQATADEKHTLYSALANLAATIEEISQKVNHIEADVKSLMSQR